MAANSSAVEYTTVTFELGVDNTVIVTMLGTDPIGGMDLGSYLTMLNREYGWEVVGMTGGMGGLVGNQRKGVVLVQRPAKK